MTYIKLLHKGNTYGPIRAPSTLSVICNVLRISPRAMPTLTSLDRTKPVVIIDMHQGSMANPGIESGFYELLVNTDVEYDVALDGPGFVNSRTPARTEVKSRSRSVSPSRAVSPSLTRYTDVVERMQTIDIDDSNDRQEFPLSEEDVCGADVDGVTR
jgi:hypothetical protein